MCGYINDDDDVLLSREETMPASLDPMKEGPCECVVSRSAIQLEPELR